jgi:alpha-1,3-rhamnosyl/mannosyltransferase
MCGLFSNSSVIIPENGVVMEFSRYYARTIQSVQKADRIIAVSRATAARLGEYCPGVADRTRIVHHGVDARWFQPFPDAEAHVTSTLGPIGDRPVVLAVGTIEPRKDYDLLLDAFRIVWEKHDREPLLIVVGQVGWRVEDTVRRLRTEQARGRLRWVERADDDLLHALYSVSSVLAVASRDEGFCLPVVEALAVGLPVVAFAVGALPEVVEDSGLLVDERTAEALAEGISAVLSDRMLRCRLVRAGKVRAAQFSWLDTARKTVQVYREALGES